MSSELKLEKVFQKAEEDLMEVQFTWLPGMILNPLNHKLVMPVTKKASDVLPAIVKALPVPYADEVSSAVLGVGFDVTRLAYSIFPFKVNDEIVDHESEEFNRESEELFEVDIGNCLEMAQNERKKKRPNELEPSWSSLMSVIGFAANSVLDILRLPFSGDMLTWVKTTMKFLGYLVISGVGEELMEGFFSPGAIPAIQIIAKIQEEANEGKTTRRQRTALTSIPKELNGKENFKNIMKEAALFVKYATAAYGVSMIDSAELLMKHGEKEDPLVDDLSKKKRRERVARYLNLPEDKIIDMDLVGGDIDIINHFLAVDERKKAVVLALRGTYSVSGIKTDAAFYSRPYCNGVAHAGIADKADNIWEKVQDTVADLLSKHSGYDLVITGHSLGAGTAALISLKLNYEKKLNKLAPPLNGVKITCFAFAPPPVYLADPGHEEIMAETFLNTHAFIHENDVVPFLSADSLRRAAYIVNEVEEKAKTKSLTGLLMAMGVKPISSNLKNIVFEDPNLEMVPGAEKLAIPAPYAIWMQYKEYDDKGFREYDAMFCRPQGTKEGEEEGTNDLQIFWDIRMVPDHMNPLYERAIASITRQIVKGADGFSYPSPN